jgi:serine/threonine protein phosphatase PrpC
MTDGSSPTPLRVIASALTDVGRQRDHNEDSCAVVAEHELFLVADGMGGHRAGDVASRLATETVAEFFRATANEDVTWPCHFEMSLSEEENRLVAGIRLANRQIFERSIRSRDCAGMGTTVVGAHYAKKRGKLVVGHVGDSRAYRMRDGALTQLTRDHSLVNDCIDAMPHLTEKQRAELPKNVITRALGMQDQVTVDLLNDVPRPGDLYLLCSDGLSGMLTDEEMVDVIGAVRAAVPRSKVPEALCRRLVERANENGGEDNVTALVIQFEGEGDADDDVLAITAPDATATPDDVAAPTERAEGVQREARAGEASGVDGAADGAADTGADGAHREAEEPSEASEGALTHGDGPRSSDASQAPPE